jgi:hypothetical protein
MSSSFKSPPGINLRTFAYENFQGLDTSRDITSLDTGKEQHLSQINNATCDWRGQMVRDPAARVRGGEYRVNHVRFFGTNELCWVEETGAGQNLKSERNHALDNAYLASATVTSTVFNQSVIFASRANPLYRYDGINFSRNQSPAADKLRPAYVTSVQRRLAVAGIPGRETQVHLTRVDQDEIFPEDEDPASTNVLRAGFIDVANLLGTADQITGLGSFEQNRLVVFTADRAIIYRIDPDIEQWVIDDNANIYIGCASHNTIQNAGTDLLFCSRSGIHSIKRSEDNGILVYSYSLSDKIDLLYRELFKSVPNKERISAVFDQDTAQYHVFFPQAGGQITKRLTLAMNPEGGEGAQPKFSTGDFLNSRCGAFLGGRLVYGTSGGVYEVLKIEDDEPDSFTPEMNIVTPLLWHGSLTDTKETYSLLIQATGKGVIEVDAIDIDKKIIGSLTIEVNDTSDDNYFEDVPLSKQYERKWSHRYKAAQYRIRSKGGGGLLRIIGFAVTVRT